MLISTRQGDPSEEVFREGAEMRLGTLTPSTMVVCSSFTVKSSGEGTRYCRDVIHKEKGKKEDHRWKHSSSARHMPRDLSRRMGLEVSKAPLGRRPEERKEEKMESVLILVHAFFKKISQTEKEMFV